MTKAPISRLTYTCHFNNPIGHFHPSTDLNMAQLFSDLKIAKPNKINLA